MSKKTKRTSPPVAPPSQARCLAVGRALAILTDGVESPVIRLRHRVINLVAICEGRTVNGGTDQDWALRSLADEIHQDLERIENDLDGLSTLAEGEGAR